MIKIKDIFVEPTENPDELVWKKLILFFDRSNNRLEKPKFTIKVELI